MARKGGNTFYLLVFRSQPRTSQRKILLRRNHYVNYPFVPFLCTGFQIREGENTEQVLAPWCNRKPSPSQRLIGQIGFPGPRGC